MYSNYNNYYPQQPQQIRPQMTQQPLNYFQSGQLQIALKGRPVSSLEEARATSIDFDGSIFYFPDLANKRIYTKQINMDGTATLCVYELREMPVQREDSVLVPSIEKFVTREEFERVLAEIRQKPTLPTESALPSTKVEPLSF